MRAKRTLIIEDDPAVCKGLRKLLENEHYEVIVQYNGNKGLEDAKKAKIDLLLLDLNLPGTNGFEICKELRKDGFNFPIIMITANKDLVDKIVGLEIGADDYITKPFDNREVVARVKANLRWRPASSDQEYSRKLLSIMFTDIKDYSKKMNENEINAFRLLSKHNKMMTKVIKEYNGNIVEIIGDAFLVTFDSAVDAVECGVNIQRVFTKYNMDTEDKNKIEIRMGIHIGDIIIYEVKVKGDAVNVAARIEEHSEAGCVTISQDVNSMIKNKIGYNTESLGTFKFKNIVSEIDLYKVIFSE